MVIISTCLIWYHVSLLRTLSTIFLFWHFTEHFERLVYESSGGEETPSHPVCHPLPLSAVLSACWPPHSPVKLSHHLPPPHTLPPHSPPTPLTPHLTSHITAKTINSAAMHSLVPHSLPISAGGRLPFPAPADEWVSLLSVTPFSVGLRELWFQI